MTMGRRVVVAWAGLCLAGAAATSALDAEPYADGTGSPAEEPAPTQTHAVNCEEVADLVEQARAEAARERAEGDGAVQRLTVMSAPEECADEIEARGPASR
ncbi:exported protein of unknown function [Streptomyces ambofaciens ATCC 23877]|uniref:Secreted protein n=1 Tax=Streptomyces ambofaciens (strain ATCC 23877 / 3486 / DSM 40053 / JCM 4204 / NBRC 12836 / NRRL B-2516) TaxID=278992 RepID=A0A0K2ARC4_STRA7|nr:hypothetical protein [Streptomyces ambofaciens]AKZ55533.1 exported protein of unknown function [Streptomyces ambofaciens ATCC 23877]